MCWEPADHSDDSPSLDDICASFAGAGRAGRARGDMARGAAGAGASATPVLVEPERGADLRRLRAGGSVAGGRRRLRAVRAGAAERRTTAVGAAAGLQPGRAVDLLRDADVLARHCGPGADAVLAPGAGGRLLVRHAGEPVGAVSPAHS